MKLFSTLIQRIATIVVVLVMAFTVNAERTFATLAEMHAATDLVAGDVVTITNDVVVEYILESFYVLRDKDGTATCVNYDYYFNEFQKVRLEGLEEYPETPPVKPGDIFKGYTASVTYSSGMLQLDPELDMANVDFVGFTAEYSKTDDYEITATKVTIRQLLDNPEEYFGKVVSLDEASTIAKGFSSYLVQGTDTLKNFRISGLNSENYPNNLIINHALCLAKYGGGCKLEMSQADYTLGAFTEIKAIKSSKVKENLPINLIAQVLRKEVYDGKTYITIMNGSGKYLMNYSGIRVCLNIENETDKTIKAGDYINLKSQSAQLTSYESDGVNFTFSMLTLEEHETSVISNEEIHFFSISPEEILMLSYYEYLPVALDGFVTLVGESTPEQSEHDIAPAVVTTVYGDVATIFLDLTYMQDGVSKFVIAGILDVPLWMGTSSKPTVVPLSAKGFMSDSYRFNNIAEMVEFGAPISSVVNYELVNPVIVTGIEVIEPVGDEDEIQNVVFVADATGSLMLKGTISNQVGEFITAVSGYYSAAVPTSISATNFVDFGVAPYLELDITEVEASSGSVFTITPIEVTIADLISSDKYASKLVKLTDFTYGEVEEVVQDETVTRHFIYQGTDSIAVDESFVTQEDKSEIVANYYLNGFYTRLLPYEGPIGEVAVDNVLADDELFVKDGIVYAQGAEIEVYDVMGRLVVCGMDKVNVAENQTIFVVRTKYSDGEMFVTKVVNR